jgi:hypothetical protein
MLPSVRRYLRQSMVVLSIGLLLAVISAGLVACGSTAGTGGSPNPTPTKPAQVQKCGSVQMNPRGIPINGSGAKQAEDCFWQAYQKCYAASLSFTTTGVDTILLRTFTIKNSGGQCAVSDAVQHAIVPAPLSAAKTYTCTSVTELVDGLHFSGCGNDGDVVMPL